MALVVAAACASSIAGATSCRLTDAGPSTARITWVDSTGFDDAFLSFRPGIQFRCAGGGRVQTSVSYQASLDTQIGEGFDTNLTHSLNADVRARLYDYNLYVSGRANAGLASVSGTDLVGSDGISSIFDDDLVQTYSASITPELRNRFGSFANSVLTTTFDVVDSEGDADFGSNSSGLNWTIRSGPRFAVMPWSVNYRTTRVFYDDRDDQRDRLIAQVSRRLDRRWSVSASLGYENNDVETSREDTDGVTWSVGTRWTPTSRTSFDASYGERYFGDTWNVQATHVSKRTTLRASFVRDITNVRNLILEPGRRFTVVDPVTGLPVVDPITGAPIIVQEFIPGLTTEDFLEETATLSIEMAGNRTNGSLQLGWSQRSYELSGLEEDDYNVRFNVSRQLQSDLSGNVSLGWQQVDSSQGTDTETYFLSLGANQRIGGRSSLGLDVSHRTQERTGEPSTDENRISLVFSTFFF